MAWFGEQAKVRIRGALANRLLAAAQLLKDTHQFRLATRFPPASKSGQYPRYRTGNLYRACTYEPKSPTEVARTQQVEVYVDQAKAPYDQKLIDSGRLGLDDTMEAIRPRVAAAMGTVP
jgi:hypothetical protein